MSALREREAADLVLDIADLVRDARIMGQRQAGQIMEGSFSAGSKFIFPTKFSIRMRMKKINSQIVASGSKSSRQRYSAAGRAQLDAFTAFL